MPITEKQRGVLKGMMIGVSLSLCIVFLAAYFNPLGYVDALAIADRLSLAIVSCMIPVVFLAAAIARLARYRFFSPEDIDGGGLSKARPRPTFYSLYYKIHLSKHS